MMNSCLYPFYEYIIKQWISYGINFPDYERTILMPEVEPKGKRIELERRKKKIWQDTADILKTTSLDIRKQKLDNLKKRDIKCELCLACSQCEKFYWEQLELALKEQGQEVTGEKCEFLIPDKINELLEQKDKPVDVYLDHYKRRNVCDANFLVILKGFSSSTPILLNYAHKTNFYSGGGIYFRWNGTGVAVDPGYLFVQNLHEYGLSVLDIDIVIVTHEHIDHSNDVRLLDDLHYNASASFKENKVSWNNDNFALSKSEEPVHKIRWYLDSVTYEEALLLARKKSGFDPEYNELYCVGVDKEEIEALKKQYNGNVQVINSETIKFTDSISVKIFPTRHEQYDIGEEKAFFKHTFGCVFECYDKKSEKRAIGYTSDTSLQTDIYDRMYELLRECQIVIANISGIYKTDVLLQEEKPRHLGYYGCHKIVTDLLSENKCKLQYVLLSEFSNQVSDIRYDISHYMQKEISRFLDYYKKERVKIIPAENGLTLDLSTMRIRCMSCRKYSDKIYVLKPFGENHYLQYICSECMYSDEG